MLAHSVSKRHSDVVISLFLNFGYFAAITSIISILTHSSPALSADYYDNRSNTLIIKRFDKGNVRDKFPELFRDNTLQIIEAKRMAGEIAQDITKIYQIYCASYQSLFEGISSGEIPSTSDEKLFVQAGESALELQRICAENGN